MFPYRLFLVVAALGAAVSVSACSNDDTSKPAPADLSGEDLIAQGRYLVTIMTCTDCHTPGTLKGEPDGTRFLGGSDVGFEIPGLGVFYGPNLTPDKETGLGSWSEQEIVTALTKGERPDGRILAPIMPWQGFAHLKQQDGRAIAAYLKSLPPVRNKAPGPFGTNETPSAAVMRIIEPSAPVQQ